MSLRNYIQDGDSQSNTVMGVDTTSPLMSLKPGFARSVKNMYPGLEGGYIKRAGYEEVLSSAWTGMSITQGIEFNYSGTRRLTVFGTDGSASGGKIGWVNSGSITEIETGLDGAARPSFVQIGEQLLFVNGQDAPIVWTGAATKQYGITPPAAAPGGVASNGAGLLNTDSQYVYSYTYYNSTTKAESSPSDLLTIALSSPDDTVDLTLVAADSDTADYIRIYRTVANGQTLFLEDEIAGSSVAYTSIAPDTALLQEMELDNTRITEFDSTPNYPIVVGNRVFLVTGSNEARFSKLGQEGPLYESFQVGAVIDTSDSFGANNKLIGHAKAGGKVIALKQHSVGFYEEVEIPDPYSPSDNTIFIYREISRNVSPIGHFAWVEVNGECIFLTKNGVYGTRGEPGDMRSVADAINGTINTLGFSSTQVEKVSAVVDSARQLVLFQVFTGSAAGTPTWTLVGDYKKYPDFRWTFYTPGTSAVTHPGIIAGCWFVGTNVSTNMEDMYFGNIESDGQLYKHTGTNDNTLGIWAEIVTRPYAGPNPFAVKLWKLGYIFAQGSGSDYDLTVSSIFDMAESEESLEKDLSLDSGGAMWDFAVFDTDEFSSTWVPRRDYHVHRKASHWQLVLRQTEADCPLTVFSWAVHGSFYFI